MKRYNQFMMLQWVIFFPLILPLTLIAGAIEGMKSAFQRIVEQIQMDVSSQP